MARVVRSTDIGLPVSIVYSQWTQFEEFPWFMEGVESVKQLDETTLQWKATVGGQEREWTSRIMEQIPDSYIAWEGFGDVQNRGSVYFEALESRRTRVTVMIEFDPETTAEKLADLLGIVGMRTSGDLERFKAFVENRETAPNRWRGEIRDGRVTRDPGESYPGTGTEGIGG
jgi:uncharacterized membrane protein